MKNFAVATRAAILRHLDKNLVHILKFDQIAANTRGAAPAGQ